jgi:hypothetical protein
MTADSRPDDDDTAWVVLGTYEKDHGHRHPLAAVHA